MSREAVETIEYKDHTIEIFQDENCESPREWANLCEIHYHSSNYILGDTNWRGDMDGYEDMLKEAKKHGDLIIPMHAYIHGGVALSLSSFYGKLPQGHAEFDSGRAGTVIVRRKKILEEYGGKILTKKLKERVYKYAQGEIKTYNQYFAGDVYGYVVDDDDSCWGYYGTKYAIEEAESIVDYLVKEERKAELEQLEKEKKDHFEQVKKWIRSKTPFQYRTSLA